MQEKFLYVIADSPDGPVKLGISKQPERRLGQLQTGHAQQLHLFHTTVVPGGRAPLFERLLHRAIGYRRSHGEWFNLTVGEAIAQIGVLFIEHEPSELIP